MRTNIECNDGSLHQENEGNSIYYSIDSHSCVGQRVNELSGGGGRGGGLSHNEDCKCVSSGPPARRNLCVIPLCVSSNSSRQDFLSFRQNPILSPILPVVEHERPFWKACHPLNIVQMFETEKKPNMLGRVLALSLVFLCLRVRRAYNSR